MGKKKKIFITTHTLRLGGVERSLIGLLNALDYSKVEVDLFLFLHDGEMMSLIPKEVCLLPENKKYAGLIQSVKTNLQKRNPDILIGKYRAKRRAVGYVKNRSVGSQNMVYDNYLQKYTLPYLPTIQEKEYDLACSFLTPHYVVTHKVKAKQKWAWIHTDYTHFEFDNQAEIEMWSPYDKIIAVSDSVSQGFVQQFPSLAPKLEKMENILLPRAIRQQARLFSVSEDIPPLEEGLNLLSVGRFSYAKNFDSIPEICKILLSSGMKIRWYLIGYGAGEELIQARIRKWGVSNQVIILGKKANPYPYMQACDVYVQPSRFEGKAVTVREAQILGKPVVITDFSTSQSQLQQGVDGWIIPLKTKDCAQALQDFLKNKDLQNTLIAGCKKTDYSNKEAFQRVFYNLLYTEPNDPNEP